MSFTIILISLYFVYMLVIQGLISDPKLKTIKCNNHRSYFLTHILPNIQNAIFTYCPLVLIFLINISIIVKLACRKMGNQGSGSKITLTLVAISILYLITQTPIAVYISFYRKQDWAKTSPLTKVKFNYYWCLTSNLAIVNNAGNFVLYCMTGAPFREQLAKIICCREQEGTRIREQQETGSRGPLGKILCCREQSKSETKRSPPMTDDSVRGNIKTIDESDESMTSQSSLKKKLESKNTESFENSETDYSSSTSPSMGPTHI